MGFDFRNCHHGIIFGQGGIGRSLYHQLNNQFPHLEIHIVTSNPSINDLNTHFVKSYDEEALIQIATSIHQIDFIINTVGCLHNKKEPEKSLRSFNAKDFLATMKINTVLTGLIAKHFHNKLSRDKITLISALSALVGSITDNKVGGWYSYRISKAALNMLIKNIHIELSRKFPKLITVAVHPGTTQTDLSKDYLKNIHHQILSPDQCAQRLISFYQSRTLNDSGMFFHANGDKLNW